VDANGEPYVKSMITTLGTDSIKFITRPKVFGVYPTNGLFDAETLITVRVAAALRARRR
jgi:hypothetical protein